MAIKLHATANEIELKKNRIKSLNEVTDHDEGYPTALAAKQYADSLKVTVDTELSDKSDNPLQNKVITVELKKLKELGETQSDWNINDTAKPSYVKNRPFYSEKVESDVWEFELPVINGSTGEGAIPTLPIPDADFSQFTNGQELEYEVYAGGELQDSGTSVFIKSVDVRKMFEDATGVTIDADVPNTLMGMGYDTENADTIFGITVEFTDFDKGIGVIHNTPNYFSIMDSTSYGGNEELPVQVKFKNFKNIVEQVHQIPDKYINWDNYVNNKKWKWEFHIPAMPFTTQPTIVTGNVSKLKADTFYFIKYTDTTETTFKLTYGEDVFVDDTLEFNRNDAWSSRDYYEFIHCISVDTVSNTVVFGKPYLDDIILPCIVPNNTKSLRIQTSTRAVNMDIKNSPFPQYTGSGGWGTGILVLADGQIFGGNSYQTYGCFTQPIFDDPNNSATMKEMIISAEGAGLILSFVSNPVCIIDPKSEDELAQVKHPRYEGLLQCDVNITVAEDRRSYNMEGTSTGVCWDPINSVTFANSFNLASIKATYPIQCYSQLKREDKKLFFKTNEANNKQTQLAVSISSKQVLTGFSITIEGEVE